MKQYGPTYQPKKSKTSEDIEQEILVSKHNRWVNSRHYAYVISIIEEWKRDISNQSQFSEEALAAASDKEVKDTLILCKKCEKEADNLIKKLS